MRKAQTMVEYAIVLAALTGIAAALFGFIRAANAHYQRAGAYVNQDCP